MENIRLEIPSIKYEKSFLDYINDYKVSGDKEYMYVYRDAYKNFKQYVSKLNNNAKANIRSEKVILNNNGIFFKSHEKDGNLYNQFEIKL